MVLLSPGNRNGRGILHSRPDAGEKEPEDPEERPAKSVRRRNLKISGLSEGGVGGG